MKNLFLLFFTILFLNNCDNSCKNQKQTQLTKSCIIIDEITNYNRYPELVKYSIDNGEERSYLNLSYFYDSIGKFNIGDTLIFVKK